MRIVLYVRNLDEEYQISLYRSMKSEAERLGIDIICVQRSLSPSAEDLAADGVILLSSVLLKRGIEVEFPLMKAAVGSLPCISVANRLPGIPSIIIHNKASMELLMDHLVNHHGYRKFLFIGGPEGHRDNTVREHVFRETIERNRANHPEMKGTVTNGGFKESMATLIMRDYMKEHRDEPLDVVVAANDNMAIGALKVLASSNDPAWNRCAVTGFDDIPQARFATPPLTTVSQPLDELARQAVRSIHALVSGQKIPEVRQIDSSLVFRASCGCSLASGNSVSNASETDTAEQRDNGDNLAAGDTKSEKELMLFRSLQSTELLRSVSVFGQELTTAGSLSALVDYLKSFLDDIEVFDFSLLVNEQDKSDTTTFNLLYRRTEGTEQTFLDAPERTTMHDFFGSRAKFDANKRSFPCAFHLQSGDDELGLIVYDAPEYTQPHICSAGVFIANTVRRLQILEEEKERSRLLETEVRLRTKDLVDINRELKKEAERRLEVEAEVLRISEMERLRFSLDLHDDICQRLAGISMFSKSLAIHDGGSLGELSSMIDETLFRTRQYAHESFPVELDSLGLNEALEGLCASLEHQTGCVCEYSWSVPSEIEIPVAKRINLYRIIQEALTNVIKHSGATRARVSVNVTDGVLDVRVSDNGKGLQAANGAGFHPETHSRVKGKPHVGIGLKSMEYRAHQIGARYHVTSSEKKGTEIGIKLTL
jgi:signal transduction histidine kinase/DNA-binding LacI/PurR family transcriptional regulator